MIALFAVMNQNVINLLMQMERPELYPFNLCHVGHFLKRYHGSMLVHPIAQPPPLPIQELLRSFYHDTIEVQVNYIYNI